MRGSLRLGTAFGIPVFMHWSFLGLLGFVALSQLFATGSLAVALNGVVFIAVIFGCVVLHEFGHVLAARRYGIGTRDVTLLPIGGIARLDRMPEDPRQELVVALAGPAVNVAIAGLLFGWLLFTGAASVLGVGLIGGTFAASLLSVNVALVVFNLLPAFPMDGGRVLRALLARKIGYLPATEIAATIGRGMAMLFGVAGLFWNPMLIFVAIFVWFGAGQEAAITRQRAAFGNREPGGFGGTVRPQGPVIEGEIIDAEIVDAPPPTGRGRVHRVGPVWVYRED